MISSHACSATPAPLLYICKRSAIGFLTHAPVCLFFGGEGGIRTHGTREGTPVFETGLFDHSSTSPKFIFPAKFEKTPATPDHTHLLKRLGAHIGDDSDVYLPQYFSGIHKPRFWDHTRQKPTGTIGQAP